MRIVLASGSPRRRELLVALGLTFEIELSDIDETPRESEAPEALVARLSSSKAEAVLARNGYRDALIIAADTVVVLDGAMLGKPEDVDQNRRYLSWLSGKTHTVFTGHCLIYGDQREVVVQRTEVVFRELSPHEIGRYVATGEGLDKAGGYAIQGRGAALVSRIDGCYFNVVGLSLATVVESAGRLGVSLV
ncbi:MAG: septum formation inhibitor Maf [Trueperaceae bacterium]|nr:MAG: septum formation inhibitor Maf [Trueperaceae bacterium]